MEKSSSDETFGVLVGWSHSQLGERLDLNLQSIGSTRRERRDDLDSHHFMLTRQQATVLANYLLKVTGQSLPRGRRGFLARWFGL